VQADLEGGNARIGRGGMGGQRRSGKDKGQSKDRPGAHGLSDFGVAFENP
jgi:hypothetical protein